MDHRVADRSVFECLVCPAPDVMFAPLGVIPNGLPSTEVEVEVEDCMRTVRVHSVKRLKA